MSLIKSLKQNDVGMGVASAIKITDLSYNFLEEKKGGNKTLN